MRQRLRLLKTQRELEAEIVFLSPRYRLSSGE